MPSRPRVAVVMGGPSWEREISIASGSEVMRALQKLGYDAKSLDYDARFIDSLRKIAPDVVFNALHGPGGEDGQIQGILDWIGIPYTGSGVQAAAISMDKHLTKKLLAAEGLPTPVWDLFDLSGGTLPLLPGALNLPLVIKPRYEGSSAGVAIVRSHEQWSAAMVEIAKGFSEAIAEEFVAGREIHCGILGEEALPLAEIIPTQDEFYNFHAKYAPGASRHVIPAPVGDDLCARLQVLALSVHRMLGLRDYSRTDFIVTDEGRPYILEINALPGLTPTSIVPDECRAIGISFENLVERLIELALQRSEAQAVAG
ncbi:MAG: D-alanine--D-alanine ligase [Candidatus Eremiobacteraeota bacterium]|nr:D-alanine--D-alanine ligase [Candidatus Eremiobacteraeota bacterium]